MYSAKRKVDEDGVYRSGIFSFGGIHDYRYEGPLIYVPLVPNSDSWTVPATKISIGQVVICQQDCNILFNTGIPYFYGPRESVDQIHRALHEGAWRDRIGVYRLNCDREAHYLNLVVEFGGVEFQWKMGDLWKKRMEGARVVCISGIRDSASPAGWTIGQRAMRKLFTVFDLKNTRMGVATASRP
ncbi:hypothetical protein X801_07734 [Opisthorchis viverrini]|uniref:Peptidase A1 domain-containing protein n=1 Tax=Opisthorchis viverrini TaxID=6198 RepID=A0A1S8WQD5_OPIVI|nr:hypothetical protein X801_07734 [Opisthorchis viverrini]